MANNYFITGMPKTGKTRIIRELVDKLRERGLRVGGIVSYSEKEHGTREKHIVMNLSNGKRALLASVDADGPKISKYHIDLRSFERLALPAMKEAGKCDVFVLDEIGPMEMRSVKFGDLLADILESDVPLIASVHGRYLADYQGWGRVLELNGSNTGRTLSFLIKRTKGYKAEKQPERKKVPEKAKKKAAPRKKKTKARRIKKAKSAPPAKPEERKEKGIIGWLKEKLGI